MVSWFMRLSPASGSALAARSLLGILSLPLSASLLLAHTCVFSLSLPHNKKKCLKRPSRVQMHPFPHLARGSGRLAGPEVPRPCTLPDRSTLCPPQGLCFNGSAFVLYLSAAVVDASSVSPERDSHNFNSWAASSFFAFLVTICYAGNTYFSFIAWRSRTIQ
uniref:MARVEL domain-containing protein n=1 Tax=Suricata suricatta TaxID=37032 RepID=A0A673TAJ9_SURSU